MDGAPRPPPPSSRPRACGPANTGARMTHQNARGALAVINNPFSLILISVESLGSSALYSRLLSYCHSGCCSMRIFRTRKRAPAFLEYIRTRFCGRSWRIKDPYIYIFFFYLDYISRHFITSNFSSSSYFPAETFLFKVHSKLWRLYVIKNI